MTVTLTTTEKTWLERIALLAVIAFVLFEWASTHKQLKATEASIAATEKARASEVQQTAVAVKEIQSNVKAARTPVAKVGLITQLAALPAPITLSSNVDGQGVGKDGASTPLALPDAIVPAVDVQPLLDFSARCAQCQLQLASANTQIKQLEGERDLAVRTAKGGSFWQRTRRVAKYVGIGILIGGTVVAVAKK